MRTKTSDLSVQSVSRPATSYGFPSDISIAITGRCQLQCRHCFNESGPRVPHELPHEVVVRLLKEIQAAGAKRVRISGGEPTLHHCFEEIIDTCAQLDLAVSLNTHGVLSAGNLNRLRTAPISLFLVSIDGAKANHDAMRGEGTFDRAVRSCKELVRAGRSVMVSMHVGKNNQEDIGVVAKVAAEVGADLKVSPLRPLGRAQRELPDAVLSPSQLLSVVKTVGQLRKQFPYTTILTDFDILEPNPNGSKGYDRSAEACKAGRSMISIGSDGRVYPCAFFELAGEIFCAGSIYDDSIARIWKTSPVLKSFQTHQKSARCQACDHYRRRCVGGCLAVSYFTGGRIEARDPQCFVDFLVDDASEVQ